MDWNEKWGAFNIIKENHPIFFSAQTGFVIIAECITKKEEAYAYW